MCATDRASARSNTRATATTSTNSSVSSVADDIDTLGRALQSGDLSSAHSAFNDLLEALQNNSLQKNAPQGDLRAQQYLNFHTQILQDAFATSGSVQASA